MKVVRALDKKNHLKIYFSLCGKREERGESGDIQTINKISWAGRVAKKDMVINLRHCCNHVRRMGEGEGELDKYLRSEFLDKLEEKSKYKLC